MFTVSIKKKAVKRAAKMPQAQQEALDYLIEDLIESGPIQSKWPNFSKLGENKYHCHLSYHWVACWTCEDDELKIEVYYAGSREDAPY